MGEESNRMEQEDRELGREPDPSSPLASGPEDDGRPEADPAEMTAVDTGFQSLDPRIIRLWQVGNLIFCVAVLAAAAVGTAFVWTQSTISRLAPIWMVPAALVLVFVLVFWLPPRRYATRLYRMGARVLELRKGIFWKTSVMIPLSRLQHVDLNQGPLERKWGLAVLEIHTAGTSNATHKLEGLDYETGKGLREKLIEAADLEEK
jgi:uncharacterized protein